ncbi:dihydroorotate dehydrogenase [Tissierella creatinini]|nr:dihydroorotate dehydrogenase [Tissierella creatinini]TJX66123.1 dihydroorotate dehydrogenase [Soehngenia saccharolytica]
MYKDLNLEIDIGGVKLKNPVMTASGTFGAGKEYSEFIDLNQLGAVVVKGIATNPWIGNPPPRIAETYGGMLNAIGLQNLGVEHFINEDIPYLRKYDTKIVVNVIGKTMKEYCEVVERLSDQDVDLIELNISCPNIKEGGVNFGTNCNSVEDVTREVKKYAKQPVIVKLSPNVTDIVEIAKAAESGGADALSLINTITGMVIDINKRKPILANITGGLSGPAIKPIGVRMVYEVHKKVKLPIVGMGGIMNGDDAIEYILAGATGVAVGTANFVNPRATIDVLEGIVNYCNKYGIKDLSEIRGIV